jgi:hypothetical protein
MQSGFEPLTAKVLERFDMSCLYLRFFCHTYEKVLYLPR